MPAYSPSKNLQKRQVKSVRDVKPALRRRSSKKSKTSKSIFFTKTKKKIIKRALIVVLLVIVSLGFLFAYSTYKYINQSFASADSTSSYSTIGDLSPAISYIVVEDFNADPIVLKKINYYVFDKSGSKVLKFDVSLDQSIDMPGNFGEDRYEKIFALGALNSSNPLNSGISYVNSSLFKMFAYKIDKYILVNESSDSKISDILSGRAFVSLNALQAFSQLRGNVKTDINLKELLELNKFVSGLPSERVATYSVKSFEYTATSDELLSDISYNSIISQEKKSIAILNGTSLDGIASFGSRVVQNLGGRIVAISNSEKQYDMGVIISEDVNSETTKTLARVFGIKNVISKENARDYSENEITRADVTVILGFDNSAALY